MQSNFARILHSVRRIQSGAFQIEQIIRNDLMNPSIPKCIEQIREQLARIEVTIEVRKRD